jgi:hypothetical protein
MAGGQQSRYGTPFLPRPRLGQRTFRTAATDSYERGCAVTGEHSLPALEAAHIKPYHKEGPHEVANGLLLRADLHRLLDKGYVTISPDLKLIVSRRLRTDFSNSRRYYPLDGTSVRPPRAARDQVNREYLQWHNKNNGSCWDSEPGRPACIPAVTGRVTALARRGACGTPTYFMEGVFAAAGLRGLPPGPSGAHVRLMPLWLTQMTGSLRP